MFVHEYDQPGDEDCGCGFAGAKAYNLQVSVDIGGGRHCCIHALTESQVESDSVAAELLRAAAATFSGRAAATSGGAGNGQLMALADGGGAPVVPRRSKGHGIHNHTAPDSARPNDGCVDPLHHNSCDVLFPGFPETNCTPISNTSPKKWSCEHDENDPG
jgi:hypothetical protein